MFLQRAVPRFLEITFCCIYGTPVTLQRLSFCQGITPVQQQTGQVIQKIYRIQILTHCDITTQPETRMNPPARCSPLPWQKLSQSQRHRAPPSCCWRDVPSSPKHICAVPVPELCQGFAWGCPGGVVLGGMRITLWLCLVRRGCVSSVGCDLQLP